MSGDHTQLKAEPKKIWAPGNELFFQIIGIAAAIFLLKSALAA